MNWLIWIGAGVAGVMVGRELARRNTLRTSEDLPSDGAVFAIGDVIAEQTLFSSLGLAVEEEFGRFFAADEAERKGGAGSSGCACG